MIFFLIALIEEKMPPSYYLSITLVNYVFRNFVKIIEALIIMNRTIIDVLLICSWSKRNKACISKTF